MARCCGGSNGVLIQAADHITIVGTGSAQDPYVIAGDVDLEVSDNTTFNLTLGGAGTAASPWTLSVGFASTAKLDDLPDVNAPAPTNAQVLGWDSATSKWTARAPTTAASGSVVHDTSLTGDGSGGTPLAVAEDPAGFLDTGASGIKLTDEGKQSLVRRYGNDAARSADPLAPDLNSVTMLDDNPGQMDYWNGVDWFPVTNGVNRDFGTEMLALSGSYVTDSPITIITRLVTTVTGADGSFDVLTSTDLAGAAGVLTCHFQETGAVPYKAMIFGLIDHIGAVAYRLDDGTAYASQSITGVVTAYIY